MPVAGGTEAPLEQGDWRPRLSPKIAGSTQLGTVWTRRDGLRALDVLGPQARPRHLRDIAAAPSSVSVLLIPVVIGASSVGLPQLESHAADPFHPGQARALEGATQIFGSALVTQSARWHSRNA